MTPSAAKRAICSSVTPHSLSKHLGGVLAKGGRRGAQPPPAGRGDGRERRPRIHARPSARMVERLEVSTGDELFVVDYLRRRDHPRDRHSHRSQSLDYDAGVLGGEPGRQEFVHRIGAVAAGIGTGELLGLRPDQLGHGPPLGIVAHRDGHPVVCSAAVHVLSGRPMTTIAPTAHHLPERLRLEGLHGGDVEHGFDHRELDQLPLTGAVGELECGHHGERGVRARERVAHPAWRNRRTVRKSCHPSHSGDLFHGRRESDPITPRPVESEGGHPNDDEPRVHLKKCGGAEPEVLHHTRREVLDHRVGPSDELLQQPDAVG